MATKNWVYRAYEPTENADIVNESMYRANEYRSAIVNAELERRRRQEVLLSTEVPEYVAAIAAYDAIKAELDAVKEEINRLKSIHRSKNPPEAKPLKAKAKEIRERLKVAGEHKKVQKRESYMQPHVQSALQEIEDSYKRTKREAYNASPLFWGTKTAIDEDLSKINKGRPPRTRRFDGGGKISMQIQNGIDCRDVFGNDRRFRIVASPETLRAMHDPNTRRLRGSEKIAECWMRIDSDGRDPVWTKFKIRIHRPLPDGLIKRVFLERRKVGTHMIWQLRLSININGTESRDKDSAVSLHPGWRKSGGGIRVGTWVGTDGRSGVVRVSAETLRQYKYLDEIKSRRDLAFNTAVKAAADWIDSLDDKPDFIVEARQYMKKWKAQRKLAALVWRCHNAEFAVPEWLEAWRKKDKRELNESSFLSRKLRLRRNDQYRVLAKQLSSEYGMMIVSDIDISKLIKRAEPDQDDDPTKNYQQKTAAPGTLLSLVKEKFGELGVVEVPSQNISRQCLSCGHVHEFDLISHKVQCHACGHTYDVDDSAAMIVLHRGLQAIQDGAIQLLVEKKDKKEREAAASRMRKQEGLRTSRKSAKASR